MVIHMIRRLVSNNYDEYGVKESYETIINDSENSELLAGFQIEVNIPYESKLTLVTYYKGGWGNEFGKCNFNIDKEKEDFYIENTRGRSSHDYHPFLILEFEDGNKALLGYAWSGNWYFHISKQGRILVGQTKKMFTKMLEPKQELKTPSVLIAFCNKEEKRSLVSHLHQFLRRYWIPNNSASRELMVEWNHWWTYEDVEINEEVFLRNVDVAHELGFELCTLDAGWYGDTKTHWSKQQGDWKLVNKEKFPNGLRYLADYVHDRGMKFGIWLEPEALGFYSKLRKDNQVIEALIDGNAYESPYICLGNPDGARLIYKFITELVEETNADFIKLDFNLDPEYGCNRIDHGHGQGDGLFQHYREYYRILDAVRERFPNLIIENCASGGLRCDFGMLQHVHTTFLSDVDVTKHSLESFYELSHFVPPTAILHFAWSETREYEDGTYVFPSFVLREGTDENAIRYTLRAAMLHQMGICRNLPNMQEEYRDIFKEQIAFYKSEVRQYLLEGQLFHLVRKDGMICIQLQLKDKSLVFCFYYGENPMKPFWLKLVALDESEHFCLTFTDKGSSMSGKGKQFMEQGVYLDGFRGLTSEILVIERKKG